MEHEFCVDFMKMVQLYKACMSLLLYICYSLLHRNNFFFTGNQVLKCSSNNEIALIQAIHKITKVSKVNEPNKGYFCE